MKDVENDPLDALGGENKHGDEPPQDAPLGNDEPDWRKESDPEKPSGQNFSYHSNYENQHFYKRKSYNDENEPQGPYSHVLNSDGSYIKPQNFLD